MIIKNKKRIYEIFIMIIVCISVIPVFFPKFIGTKIDWFAYGILVIDYVVRFIIAKGKKVFFKDNLFDLVAILPLGIYFRFARLIRVFRVFNVSKRVFGGKAVKKIVDVMKTHGLDKTLYVLMFVVIGASLLIEYVEPNFGTFDDALWWSIVTVTTVGYGDFFPETGWGRIVAVVLMFFGIGIMGLFTSSLMSAFSKDNDSGTTVKSGNNKVDYIKAELDRFEELTKKELVELSGMVKGLK